MTTIAISKEIKKELEKLKEHPRESYEEVVKRLINTRELLKQFKWDYDEKNGLFHFGVKNTKYHKSIDIEEAGIVLDFNKDKELVGIEFLRIPKWLEDKLKELQP